MADDTVRNEIVQGLLYAHTRSNLNTIEAHQARADVLTLIELLIAKGIVERSEIDTQRKTIDKKLREEFVEKGMAVAIHEQKTSKYDYVEECEIDCAERAPLCKAACCRLSFALSKEDVEEGIVRWNLGQPYMIAYQDDGYCTHLGSETRACTVYEHRPRTCRKFDCRQDRRIWLDFEKRIPNPKIGQPGWPEPDKQPDP